MRLGGSDSRVRQIVVRTMERCEESPERLSRERTGSTVSPEEDQGAIGNVRDRYVDAFAQMNVADMERRILALYADLEPGQHIEIRNSVRTGRDSIETTIVVVDSIPSPFHDEIILACRDMEPPEIEVLPEGPNRGPVRNRGKGKTRRW